MRVMIYEYLLTENVQPTACKRPSDIPICNISRTNPISKLIRKEAYAVYPSSNNIILNNSRLACLWFVSISSFLSTQEEQPLQLTFDLRGDNSRRLIGQNNNRKADQKCFFHLLSPRSKLDLTIIGGSHLLIDHMRRGALDLLHGFALATSTSTMAPAVGSRCQGHRCIHQSCHREQCRRLFASAVRETASRAIAMRGLRDPFTSVCRAECEHLPHNGTRDRESTIRLDVRCLTGDPNCFICFTKMR